VSRPGSGRTRDITFCAENRIDRLSCKNGTGGNLKDLWRNHACYRQNYKRTLIESAGTPFPKISTWVLWLDLYDPFPQKVGVKPHKTAFFELRVYGSAYTKKYKGTLKKVSVALSIYVNMTFLSYAYPKRGGGRNPTEKHFSLCGLTVSGRPTGFQKNYNGTLLGSQGHPSNHANMTRAPYYWHLPKCARKNSTLACTVFFHLLSRSKFPLRYVRHPIKVMLIFYFCCVNENQILGQRESLKCAQN